MYAIALDASGSMDRKVLEAGLMKALSLALVLGAGPRVLFLAADSGSFLAEEVPSDTSAHDLMKKVGGGYGTDFGRMFAAMRYLEPELAFVVSDCMATEFPKGMANTIWLDTSGQNTPPPPFGVRIRVAAKAAR